MTTSRSHQGVLAAFSVLLALRGVNAIYAGKWGQRDVRGGSRGSGGGSGGSGSSSDSIFPTNND